MFVSNGRARTAEHDFSVRNLQGSFVILVAQTEAAERWFDAHVPADAIAYGRNGIAVEPRYLADILNGIVEDGLTIQL